MYDAHSATACIGMRNRPVDPSVLTALSPLDGRYAKKASALRGYLSEYALIRYRTLVEVRWLQHLASEADIPELGHLDAPVKDVLNGIIDGFSVEDAQRIKSIESKTNHDVKAVEYFLREKLSGVSSPITDLTPFIHFACTSEDINNLAYALMLRDARQRVLLPNIKSLATALRELAHEFAELPMLSRTHGQPASPTTLGKEIAVFVYRIDQQLERFTAVPILGKINGAVGNFNAHIVAYPDADWCGLSNRFIESLNLTPAIYTTQIEAHDWIADYSQALCRLNVVLIDFCQDVWGYVSRGYFRSRAVAGEVGSSTMPHKVNPIEFENAEGNLGVANAVLEFLAGKLPKSRLQRDLTDSTVLRNLGVGIGHSLIAIESAAKGVSKLEADEECITADLAASPEVLTEAVQTVMRRYGIADAYEQLKEITRGQVITAEALESFIEQLDIPEDARQRLLDLEPARYVGIAAQLARDI